MSIKSHALEITRAGLSARLAPPVLAAGLALFSLAAALTAVAQDERSSAGDPAIGETLYYEHGCYGCHGFNGETGVRDLVATNSPIIADQETFISYLRLRADQAPVLPSTRMPNYPEESLSDEQARHLYAYVASFELNAPEIDDVPAFNQIIESASRPYTP